MISVRKGETRIATINVRGLKKHYKKDAAGPLLSDLGIGVCIVTQTHMYKAGAKALYIEGYGVQTQSCRTDAPTGGVLILVKIGVDSEEVIGMPPFPPLVIVCSVIVYANATQRNGYRVTGVYLSPSAR